SSGTTWTDPASRGHAPGRTKAPDLVRGLRRAGWACWWPVGGSALVVGGGRRRAVQLVGLVLEPDGDLLQRVTVLTGVVGAEEQLATGLQLHAEVGLRSATVAAALSGQSAGGNGRCHFGLISLGLCQSQRYEPAQDSPGSVSSSSPPGPGGACAG